MGLILGAAALWLGPGSVRAEALVYLNFDGATLSAPPKGQEEHAAKLQSELVSRLGKTSLVIPPARFGGQYSRDIVLRLVVADVQKHYAGLGLRVVTQKPIDDRYTMIVIGGKSDVLGLERELGWGTTDCENKNPRNVGFVFSDTINGMGDSWDTTQVAATISQELAHTFGLEHVEGPDDLLMRPVPAKVSEYRFGDRCLAVVPGPAIGPTGPGCKSNVGCPEQQQNDRAVLKQILGESSKPGGTPGTGNTSGGGMGNSTAAMPGSSAGPGAAQPDPGGGKENDGGCAVSLRPEGGGYGLLLGGLLLGLRRRSGRVTPRSRQR